MWILKIRSLLDLGLFQQTYSRNIKACPSLINVYFFLPWSFDRLILYLNIAQILSQTTYSWSVWHWSIFDFYCFLNILFLDWFQSFGSWSGWIQWFCLDPDLVFKFLLDLVLDPVLKFLLIRFQPPNPGAKKSAERALISNLVLMSTFLPMSKQQEFMVFWMFIQKSLYVRIADQKFYEHGM